jgi:hypothetical protein
LNRLSIAISTNDSTTKKIRRVSKLGPCLKNRGAISISSDVSRPLVQGALEQQDPIEMAEKSI